MTTENLTAQTNLTYLAVEQSTSSGLTPAAWSYLKDGGTAGVLLVICFAGVIGIMRTKSR